jgi:hypothetical protein
MRQTDLQLNRRGHWVPLQFSGDAERKEYYRWLSAFPERSKQKIGAINRAAVRKNHPPRVNHDVKHIVMSIRAAVFDTHVRQLVQAVIKLRKALYQDTRALKRLEAPDSAPFKKALAQQQKSAEAMQDLHIAIDWVTGVASPFEIPAHRRPLVEERQPALNTKA